MQHWSSNDHYHIMMFVCVGDVCDDMLGVAMLVQVAVSTTFNIECRGALDSIMLHSGV